MASACLATCCKQGTLKVDIGTHILQCLYQWPGKRHWAYLLQTGHEIRAGAWLRYWKTEIQLRDTCINVPAGYTAALWSSARGSVKFWSWGGITWCIRTGWAVAGWMAPEWKGPQSYGGCQGEQQPAVLLSWTRQAEPPLEGGCRETGESPMEDSKIFESKAQDL